jgi:hypothetical protein
MNCFVPFWRVEADAKGVPTYEFFEELFTVLSAHIMCSNAFAWSVDSPPLLAYHIED